MKLTYWVQFDHSLETHHLRHLGGRSSASAWSASGGTRWKATCRTAAHFAAAVG